MDRKRLAEEKFRPLKKRMQATMKRIKEAALTGTLPDRGLTSELLDQVRIMISYPGFGDTAYPALLMATEQLDEALSRKDIDGFQKALTAILSLQKQCHASRPFPPPLAGGGQGVGEVTAAEN